MNSIGLLFVLVGAGAIIASIPHAFIPMLSIPKHFVKPLFGIGIVLVLVGFLIYFSPYIVH